MLIVFPLGLLGTGTIFDIIRAVSGTGRWSDIAFWMIGAGVIGGLLAAVFGLIDWLAIPSGTRAKSIGLFHGGANVVAVVLFAGSWFLRRGHAADPGAAPVVLSIVGLAIALVGGWLGGELVDRLGVGVDDGAHLDSPNSLSGLPAGAGASTTTAPIRSESLGRM
jgi:uncharacterized membrane protein